jgi:microtubule-associated protein 1
VDPAAKKKLVQKTESLMLLKVEDKTDDVYMSSKSPRGLLSEKTELGVFKKKEFKKKESKKDIKKDAKKDVKKDEKEPKKDIVRKDKTKPSRTPIRQRKNEEMDLSPISRPPKIPK